MLANSSNAQAMKCVHVNVPRTGQAMETEYRQCEEKEVMEFQICREVEQGKVGKASCFLLVRVLREKETRSATPECTVD